MKSHLLRLMEEAERLLRECGWPRQAAYWTSKIRTLRDLSPGSKDFQQEIKEIGGILVGMGSFTDIPLYPPDGYPLDGLEARKRQGELAEEIGAQIRKLTRTAK